MTLVKKILDYAATRPNTIITYHASDMVLSAHSDASYLSESKARSRAGGHFFHVKRLTHYRKQRSRRHHLPNHQSSHVLRGGSVTGSSLRQLQVGHPGTSRPQGNGAQTASHANANRQHDCPQSGNQQHCKQTFNPTPRVPRTWSRLTPTPRVPRTWS